MPTNDLTLCLIFNEPYLPGALALLRSLHYYNDATDIPLLIFSPVPLSTSAKTALGTVHRTIDYQAIDFRPYQRCHFNAHREWDLSPASRYELFRIQTHGQVLYMDVDMLVTGDISEVLRYRGPLGACSMPPGEGMELKHTSGFNSGLLSLDASYRNPQTWWQVLRLAEQRPWSGNQTVLNLRFGKNFDDFGMRYNMFSSHVTHENIRGLRIIHFVGRCKPWDADKQFAEHQFARAGPEVCNELLSAWRRFG